MTFSIDEILLALKDPKGAPLANLLNSLSLLKETLGEGAWVGFYIYSEKKKTLLLGPFQGKEACLSIAPNKGVVGSSFSSQKEIYVPDVNQLTNYISCDPLTRSEFVYPLKNEEDEVYAIFDVDSPKLDGLRNFLPILKQYAEAVKVALDLRKIALGELYWPLQTPYFSSYSWTIPRLISLFWKWPKSLSFDILEDGLLPEVDKPFLTLLNLSNTFLYLSPYANCHLTTLLVTECDDRHKARQR